ncbi:PREDICTED: GDSL esterase/lipase At1g29670-like [Prunus mume]|uniref:GDSL esterase/lipase At1g29670-like n=1 Tax=Prunus mume TaxID=102107 RepID=A0ABM1LL88_PRUMU|nr:PREDICTED: GDSL esterase/lipase At1g29670-like [Prunus mume]
MAKAIALGFILILVLVVSISQSRLVNGAPQVPCFFIFGDSLADNGNNNNLLSFANANYQPYGIDFPTGPTGRFCNGRTTVDILAQLLGFENPIPSFGATRGPDILKGLNYASGSAGIRAETGFQVGARISLDQQLQNHQVTVSRIASTLGNNQSALQYLNKCLYSVGMGSNDYINNYFLPQYYDTSRIYNPEQYATVLIDKYSCQIASLYKNGARKVALIGLGPIGCTPNAMSTFGTKGSACVNNMNSAVQLFNQKLLALVNQLNTNLTDAKFIYVNSFGMASGDPAAAGFKVVNVGCCQVNNLGQCAAGQTPCQNRSEYAFWDGFHPTEALNQITARRTYIEVDPSDTYPSDISHLVQLSLSSCM